MNTSRIGFRTAALVSAIVAGSLTACGGPSGTVGTPTAASTGGTSTASAAQPAVTPAVTNSASAPATSSATESSPAVPAASQTYTFPDGHLSFSYPAGWTVKTVEQPFVKGHASGAKPVDATVSDGAGNELALIQSNTYAGGASTDVQRSFLDQAPLPGLTASDGSALVFGFIQDASGGSVQFHAGVRKAKEFQPGFATSGTDYFELGNGMTVAKVIFDNPAFDSTDAARAWMATGQYSELKKLFLTLKYN